MPEGPFEFKRFNNIGPLTRATKEELKNNWQRCPKSGKANEICQEIKVGSIAILENQKFFAKCDTLVDINSGQCFKVAEQVVENVGGVTALRVGDGDHFWIEYNGRHYDAEVPSGVDEFRKLPFFGRADDYDMMEHVRLAKPDGVDYPVERVEDTIVDVTDKIKSNTL